MVRRSYLFFACLAACGTAFAQKVEGDNPDRMGESVVINVEVDWLVLPGGHDHRLSDCEMDAVIAAFSRHGIVLNIEWSDAIEETAGNRIINILGGNFNASPEWQAVVDQYRDHPPGSGWHYCLLGHQYANNGVSTTSSGLAEIGGDEFIVSLGGWTGQTGLPFHRSGTFMHEFGHNLGLRHGGFENSNYKPNYVSVMNYYYQVSGVWNTVTCNGWNADGTSPLLALDYSRGLQEPLNENALLEEVGMGAGEVDWDCNAMIETDPIVESISGSSNYCNASGTPRVVNDYDDWSNVTSNAFSRQEVEAVACVDLDEILLRGGDPCDTPDPCLILLPPGIIVTTEGIDIELAANDQAVKLFEIANTGDLPLEWTIAESSGACSPIDITWLTLSRTSGLTASANSDLIEVTIDTTGVAVGFYQAELCIASNDAQEPNLTVPIGLAVLPDTLATALPFWQRDPLYLNILDLMDLL